MRGSNLPYRAILFDFDYTLADSSEGIIRCVNSALQTLALPQADPDDIRATIGLSLTDIYAQLAGQSSTACLRSVLTRSWLTLRKSTQGYRERYRL
jgi:phosphoglycolate phosphatase-like HAD superfamily hydrolase